MLEIGFKSFSRISLAGFLDDFKSERIKKFDFVGNYDMVCHALGGFSLFLQLSLFVYSYILFESYLPHPIYRFLLLVFIFLFVFNFFLYTVSYSNRDSVLKLLIALTPVAWAFFYPAKLLFSIFLKTPPEEKESEQDDPSEKEVEVFLEEAAKEGVLESEDKEMIVSILEFGDTLVKEIMTPRVDMVYVDKGISLDQLVTLINEKKRSRYPVIAGRIDHIEGIILSKDVFDYWHNSSAKDFSIGSIMRKPFFIPETMRIFELLRELQMSKQKFAIVADEFGGISGVVTMEDIIEEIVGEIHDEYDEDTENIVKEKDYFIVKGDTDVSELADTLKIKIDEDEDYQTVAGLMSFLLGKIPGPGDSVSVEGYMFEVTEVEKNRIKKVRIAQQVDQ
jgi:CBS domain containing-hemolysin-like protein